MGRQNVSREGSLDATAASIVRYLNDPLLHARVDVICKTMGWVTPRPGGHPHILGVEDAIQILDALAASGVLKEGETRTDRVD